MDHVAQLKELPRTRDFFIGFDSDGCVFDTMEIKQKECFCPAFIKHMGLQPVSKAAREVWEFVNLYSKTRGCNRFVALQHARDLLMRREDIRARGFSVPGLRTLDAWIGRESKLGNPALEAEVERTGDGDLRRVLDWSREVNERVAEMVSGMPPFPFVREVLDVARENADLIVVSQTPLEALVREWDENHMTNCVALIAGQEQGTKTEHIRFATAGKGYSPNRILMVGDAPGDAVAAQDNRALFFPIVPGREEASWERLAHEGLACFFSGRFEGAYQAQLIDEFDAALPAKPVWKEVEPETTSTNKKECRMNKADIGLIGLAVMGENLVLNMESKGFTVAVFNRTVEKVDAFVNGRGAGKNFIGCRTIDEFCAALQRPRKVMMLVKAGKAVDDFIDRVLPHLEPGDIIIDGGNSHFPDTIRRTAYVEGKGLLYIGTGVSGGEEGALLGPSIMPGGSPAAWDAVKPIFQKICAHTEDGEPCCDWVGENGAGHFVKMVHNGIEYGDMQMICETYQMMKQGLGMSNEEMHEVFAEWNRGELDSYLIEITRDILGCKDETGAAVLDVILDTAGQKGTGKWTASAALDVGQPLTLIGEAVFARCLSALKDERVAASKLLKGPVAAFDGDRAGMIDDLKQALYASKIVSYAQGYQLMRAAAGEHGWNLNNGGIALMWRGGCIIRSVFLGKIKEAFDANPDLVNLLLDPFFKGAMDSAQAGWRRVVCKAVELGIPMPAISSALAYYDGYRCARLPANLLQAQRDYFGAHTYERVDKPRGEFFHTNWTGRGGSTAASTYVV